MSSWFRMLGVPLSDDDGTDGLRVSGYVTRLATRMLRVALGDGQLLMLYVPVDDVTFDANLAAVKLRGADGPLSTQMRVAGLDDALAELAAREG